jgi:hypothetical protein
VRLSKDGDRAEALGGSGGTIGMTTSLVMMSVASSTRQEPEYEKEVEVSQEKESRGLWG